MIFVGSGCPASPGEAACERQCGCGIVYAAEAKLNAKCAQLCVGPKCVWPWRWSHPFCGREARRQSGRNCPDVRLGPALSSGVLLALLAARLHHDLNCATKDE